MSNRYDFLLKAGSTHILDIIWRSEDDLPVMLTGYTANMQIRENDHRGRVISTLTTDNGIELGYVGSVKVTIPASDTENVTSTHCVYDLELVNGEHVERILEGKIRISPNVTRVR